MMKLAIALVLVAAVPALAFTEENYEFLFRAWRTQHAKEYATPEEAALRFAIFRANLDRVNSHNSKGLSYTMAMNEFGDLTPTEFSAGRIGGYVPRRLRKQGNMAPLTVEASASNPASIDWVSKGAVTAVKNQGQCGSCWSFSTTGSVEGITEIKTGELVSLSEQMLMDCSTSYGNMGCNGGLMDDAFKYIIANGGICSESAYPYTAHDGTCRSNCQKVATISGYHDVTANSDSALETAVAGQPVSVAIEADQSSFQFYSGGIMSGNCGTNLDHGVLVVGYASEYFKVKNSWGASWGESGYIRLARGNYNNGAGQCGILMDASYPTK